MINSWHYTINDDAIKRDSVNDKCDITVYCDAIKWGNYMVITLIYNRDSINRNIDKVNLTLLLMAT